MLTNNGFFLRNGNNILFKFNYIKNSEYKYMEIIKKNIENINTNKKKEKIFGEEEPNSLIIIPSVVFLSLTTIIHYFYSLIC